MHSYAWWPTLIVLVVATFTDLRNRTIPNWLVLPFLLSGVLVSVLTQSWKGAGQSVLGMLAGALLMGVLSYLGGMGMGDVKLCAAIGAWVGPSQLLTALVFMGLAGGVLAIIWAFAHDSLKRSFDGVGDLLTGFWKRGFRPHPTLVLSNSKTLKMPYAPAIAIGTILSFFAL